MAQSDETPANEDGVFDVKSILSQKYILNADGGDELSFYLIEWAGWDFKDASWVHSKNVNSPDEMRKFMKSISSVCTEACEKCKMGGKHCSTIPCFKHHVKKSKLDWGHIFDIYTKEDIRTISKIETGISTKQVEDCAEE